MRIDPSTADGRACPARSKEPMDLVRAILQRVKAVAVAGHITDESLLAIERDIRSEFGGQPVYVAARLPKKTRWRLIVADLDAGFSVAETARKHGVSSRTVNRAGKNECDNDAD